MRQIKNIKIERIAYGWVGIARASDGKKILIKWWALPGSIVDITVKKKKNDYIEGHISKIHQYDDKYLDWKIFCSHFFSNIAQNGEITDISKSDENIEKYKIGCGGCKWQLISYPKQLELKQGIVADCFRKIKNKPEFLPIVPSPNDKWYRNKIEFSFGVYISDKEGVNSKWNLWFHKQWEFSKVVDIDNCGLISPKANEVFEHIKTLCFQSWLATYDQKFNRWFFRHLVIREWINTGQMLINLSVHPNGIIDETNKDYWKNLKITFENNEFLKKNINSFVITYNDSLADIVRGDNIQTEILWWNSYIYEKLKLNISSKEITPTFRISPFSFFQTNTHGAEKLFETAMQNVLSYWEVKWKILDLYCGAGSIGISFLKAEISESLLWVEIVEEAICDANHNAEINAIPDNCKFIASASEKILSNNPEISEEINNIGLVIVDPPREWLHKNVIEWIAKLKSENNFKLLYISCNPSTMARDVELFLEKWFKIQSLQAVDMFPQTHHIETIWILI